LLAALKDPAVHRMFLTKVTRERVGSELRLGLLASSTRTLRLLHETSLLPHVFRFFGTARVLSPLVAQYCFSDARHIKVSPALWDVGLQAQSRMKFRVLSKDLPRQRHLRMSVQLALALSGLLLQAAAKTGAGAPDAGWTDEIENELTDVLKIGLRVSRLALFTSVSPLTLYLTPILVLQLH
jgi:tRNA nucleotidyltransferase/poly(A) polymerase